MIFLRPGAVLLIAALCLGAPCVGNAVALAAKTQSLDNVASVAEQALRERFATPGSRMEITAQPLSTRLQLAACDQPLRAIIAKYVSPSSRLTVRVQCPQAGGWTVPVAVRMKLFRQVLVASRPLLRGDGLGNADVHTEERDITRLGYGYLDRLDQVTGRTLSRAVTGGTVISPGVLGGRRMVRAGDHVQLVAKLNGIEVRADGVALGSGDNGARLRVRNESSGRVVDAMVSAPGMVLALP